MSDKNILHKAGDAASATWAWLRLAVRGVGVAVVFSAKMLRVVFVATLHGARIFFTHAIAWLRTSPARTRELYARTKVGSRVAWKETREFSIVAAHWLRVNSVRAYKFLRAFAIKAYAVTRVELARTPEHIRTLRVWLRDFDRRRLHPRAIWKTLRTWHARVHAARFNLLAWLAEVRAHGDGQLTRAALQSWMRENEVKFGIGAQFFSALGGAVTLILLASLVGLISLTQVSGAQHQVNREVVPGMRVAFRVARESAALVAATPRLMTVNSNAEYRELSSEITRTRVEFARALASLDPGLVSAERLDAVRELGGALVANLQNVDATVAKELGLRPLRRKVETGVALAQRELGSLLDGAIDDQFFFLATGHRALNRQPVGIGQRQSIQEVMTYRWLQTLRAETNNAVTLIENTLSQPDLAYLRPIRERYNATVRHIEASLNGLEGNKLQAPLTAAVTTLLELGGGVEGAFAVRGQELTLANSLKEYLDTSRDLSVRLGLEAARLTRNSSELAQRTSEDAEQAVNAGRAVLVALNTVSLAGAVLIAWLYVGRILLHRIGELSNAMLRMADGDLRVPLSIKGRDEVAEMGRALEVFRKHALEAQRLNLVEKLAEELRSKNAELERAQDQIVMREKLAALGELTAGIAHEIKNPLNFVNNFSQLSMELITEIREIMGEGKTLSDEQRAEVNDIFGDLTTNLGKINEHGKRADSIVKGMLRHGRSGEGGFMPIDMNAMLSEYSRLAYHSARANNPDFNVTLHEEFANDVGMVEVVPQDWSRVLLNLVTNACDATDEKRRKEARGSYEPEVWLVTKRSGDEVEIRVRDNGPGIPENVRAKMFNPFFTTKPTDKGTGLGLSISHDIVQQHSGSLDVESEVGVGTEMVIRVPVKASATDGDDDAGGGGDGGGGGGDAPAPQTSAPSPPSTPSPPPTPASETPAT